ncbi:MAG: hydroxyisourate hydrolase [Myxococcota bacterium]
MPASAITTHILDTAVGRPAAGVPVEIYREGPGPSTLLGQGVTDEDGRISDLLAPGPLEKGTFRLVFYVGPYLEAQGRPGFYPEVPVIFQVQEEGEHYHVPLLLNPFGYSTYRGS